MCEMTVTRARSLIGVPFRLHGRNPRFGLDCVGLAAEVFGEEQVAAAPLKALAGSALSRGQWARRRAKICLPWTALDLRPATLVSLPDDDSVWRVSSVSLNRMVVEAELVANPVGSTALPVADPGSGLLQPDRPHGPTALHLFDLPVLDDETAFAPRVAVAAAGVEHGWKRANLLTSIDDGSTWQEAGSTAAAATMGRTLTRLETGSSLIEDRLSTLDIELLHDGMVLHDADRVALLSGENAAIVGQEIVQFARAEPIGPASYRLSGLLRGRRGTEWAMGAHIAGEPFVLLDAQTIALLPVPAGTARVRLLASGVGDDTPASAALDLAGEAIRPLAPVHLCASKDADGGLRVSWIRRSRNGWRWIDGVDAPLGEEREAYHVTVEPDVGAAISAETAIPEYRLPGDVRDLLHASGASRLTISIRQVGSHAVSRPCRLTITLA